MYRAAGFCLTISCQSGFRFFLHDERISTRRCSEPLTRFTVAANPCFDKQRLRRPAELNTLGYPCAFMLAIFSESITDFPAVVIHASRLTYAAVGIGVFTAALLFKLFFKDVSGFWECLRFWFRPDIFSLFKGEWFEDQWSELKLLVWAALATGCEAFLTNDTAIKRVNELHVLVLSELQVPSES